MAPQRLGYLGGCGQTEARLGEHHRGEAPRALVIGATGEDRTRSVKEGKLLVEAGDGEVHAHHLSFCGEQGNAVLQFHWRPYCPGNLYA